MVETSPIVACSRLTLGELRNATRWHWQQRAIHFIQFAVWILLLVASNLIAGSIYSIFVIFLLFNFVLPPLLLRRRFAKCEGHNQEVEWTFTNEQVQRRSPEASSEFGWSALGKVIETPDGFLLYPKGKSFDWVPRHGFENVAAFERLAELAKERVPEFEVLGGLSWRIEADPPVYPPRR